MSLQDFEYDISGNKIAFDGNNNIKSIGVRLPYTKAHLEEWTRCKNDWCYFAENYVYIINLNDGKIKPTMRDYQKNMVESFINNSFNLVLASRQIGKTVSTTIFLLHFILFNQDKNVAILANKASTSIKILRELKNMYELLPKWLQQGVKVWNSGAIRLENGCSIFASSTSSSSIRGESVNVLFIDECAFIPANTWDCFFESVFPTISSSNESKVIFVSTPNGLNHFYKFWKDSEEGRNKFVRTRVDWWEVPGRDEVWKENMLSTLGIQKFSQEFGNNFLGSSDTLIEEKSLTNLKFLPAKENSQLHQIIPAGLHKFLNVYEERERKAIYVLGIDSSRITEISSGDACCIQVLDISCMPFKQVATFFAKNDFNYMKIPQIAYDIGKYYNWATAFIENNDIGQEISNILHFDYEYESVFFQDTKRSGFRTTKKTKRLGYNNLKLLVENNKIILNDFITIAELSTFVRHKDSYKAESGYTDDATMALIAALFFMQRAEFEVFENSKQMAEKILDITVDDDLPSFGFIDDSVESTNEFNFNEIFK